jgi:hypothetical protein
VFDGRVIMAGRDRARIHKEVLEFESIEAISEPMRELIEDLWVFLDALVREAAASTTSQMEKASATMPPGRPAR